MDNAVYVGLSRQMILQRELDITANNLANVDTAGFKVENLMTKSDPALPAKTIGMPTPVTFVLDNGVARDFSQGPVTQTGGPLDMALQGPGFFQVNTADGVRYTRDGRFTMDASGKLVTQNGDAVQGAGGDITLDPTKGPVSVAPTGIISQAGAKVGQLAVVTFSDMSGLQKDGSNLFENTSNLASQPATNTTIQQGMLEGSNVQPVLQITRLIDVSRAYDAINNMMNNTADLSNRAIQRLGSAN